LLSFFSAARGRLLFCLVFLSQAILSAGLPETLPISDIEGGDLCMVEGVNIITGSYNYHLTPLTATAPEPISYNMGYNSDLLWQDNLEVFLWFAQDDCRYYEYGTASHFRRCNSNRDSIYSVRIRDPKNCGLTNLGQGSPSGKSSHRNLSIRVLGGDFNQNAILTKGDGSRQTYCRITPDEILDYMAQVTLSETITPRGNRIKHLRRPIRQGFSPVPFGIETLGASIKVKKRLPGMVKPTAIETSNGRTLNIDWRSFSNHLVPSRIQHPQLPSLSFQYCLSNPQKKTLLSEIREGSEKRTKIRYHQHEPRYQGRVEALSKNTEQHHRYIDLYTFSYKFKNHKDMSQGGKTTATNCLGEAKTFTYDEKLHIRSIEYRAPGSRIREDQFGWQDEKLNSKRVLNENLKEVFYQTYIYDTRGNITKQTTSGTLTGLAPQSHHDDLIQTFKYSSDGFNNLIEHNDGDTVTRYSYKKGTSLCTSELVTHSGNILRRKFYDYDENGTLIEEIADDGVSEDPAHYSDCTRRLITRVKPNSMGLPEEIQKFCQDPHTGGKHLLKRILKRYTKEGWLQEQITYDANNQFCFTQTWEYNRFGKVTREVDPMGYETLRTYDDYGRMIAEETPLHKITYSYDLNDQPVSKTIQIEQNLELTEQFAYDPMGNMTSSTDVYGHQTIYKIDPFGRLSNKTLPDGSRFIYWYDCFGKLTKAMDPKGFVTKTSYTCTGLPLTITRPDKNTESQTYYLNGLPYIHTAPNGTKTVQAHDCLKRPTAVKIVSPSDELLSISQKIYDRDSLAAEIDPAGVVTNHTYDGAGRKIETVTNDRRTTFEYDSLGRLSTVKKWKNENEYTAAIKVYDFCDRIIEERVEDETGKIYTCQKFEYDQLGRRTKVIETIDGQPAATKYTYNGLGDITSITDPEGHVTQTLYDYGFVNDQGEKVLQKTVINPKGVMTVSTFDIMGRSAKIETINPFGLLLQKSEHQYDLNGNRIQTTHTVITPNQADRLVTTKIEYDCMNRPIKLIEADEKVTETSYNDMGAIEKVTKPNGTCIRHEYNALGLLSRQYSEGSPSGIDYKLTYDDHQNIAQVLDLIAGQTTTRTYNAFSELTSEILPHGHLAEYAYDSLGRRIKASIDGKTADYAYDAVHLRSVSYGPYTHTYDEYDQGRLKQGTLVDNTKYDLSYTLNGQPSSRAFNSCQEDLTYDPNDNLINKTLKDPFGTESFIFEYDELDQLCYEETNVPCKLIHDSLNNRVQKDDSEYQLNDLNQITGIDDDFFTYDPNGNLIASSTAAYTYDALDRLISITQNGQTTRYTYGPFHRRLTSKTQNETHYLYLENNEVGSKSPHKEEFRVLGQGLGAEIGAAVLIELDGQIYAPIHDHTGSVVCLLSPSGRATQAYRYTPFGETIKTESSLKNPWRFSSKRHDPTGLIYFGRRYYDPTLGRWLTCDPRGFDDGPNLYAYVHNNPLTHFDEYGLFDDYWDMTADEAATYDREAYAKGAVAPMAPVRRVLANPRVQGPIQAFGGLMEATAGGYAIVYSGGFGAGIGFAAMTHGLDHFTTGMNTALSGRHQHTGTEQLLHMTGMPPGMAAGVDTTISIIGMGYGAAIAARSGQVATIPKFKQPTIKKIKSTPAGLKPLRPSYESCNNFNSLHNKLHYNYNNVIHVTKNGVALPSDFKYQIPKCYLENPYRSGSYGLFTEGKFSELLRIDAPTGKGYKGPNYSHYHLDGKKTHFSPRGNDFDPGFQQHN